MPRHAITRAAIGALLLAVTASAQVWPTVKEWDSGPSAKRLDVVIMGDGYTAAQIPLFRTHVTNLINAWFAAPPLNRYKNMINVWRVEVESAQSGADKPMPCWNPEILVNTALNSKYCTGGTMRCLTASTSLALGVALTNVPEYDEVVVVVNDGTYGGCAGTISTYTGVNASSLEVGIHEMGHSIFGLADEYWTTGTTYTSTAEPSQPNATRFTAAQTASMQTKWHYWLGIESVNHHEGCRYYEFGLYRPRNDCKMRTLNQTFCPVCREDMLEDVWDYVPAFDAVSPAPSGGPYGSSAILSADLPAAGIGAWTPVWRVDGSPVAGGTQTTVGNVTTLAFDPAPHVGGVPGSHTVTLELQDATTWYRKVQPFLPIPSVTWNLTDTIADLVVSAFAPLTTPSLTGEAFEVTGTVTNTGPGTSPPVRVGYYLSLDATISNTDILVGYRDVPALAPGASSAAVTGARAPSSTLPFVYRLGAVADDQNDFFESSESNNTALSPQSFLFTNPAWLTNDTPVMNWSIAATATLSLNAGPAHAGEPYYLFASVTLPGAGTDLTPFGYVGVADMMFDAVSISVATNQPGYGFPFFQGFQGTLGPQGQASASFYKPGIPPLPVGIPIFFWYLTTTPDGLHAPVFSNDTFVFVF